MTQRRGDARRSLCECGGGGGARGGGAGHAPHAPHAPHAHASVRDKMKRKRQDAGGGDPAGRVKSPGPDTLASEMAPPPPRNPSPVVSDVASLHVVPTCAAGQASAAPEAGALVPASSPAASKCCNLEHIRSRLRNLPFGRSALKSLFKLDPSALHVNHGGCGATPSFVIAKQKQLLEAMESFPDRWFHQTVPRSVRASAADLATFIGADPQDVVFVVNATTGINSVIRSLDLQQGDAVLCLDLTYRPVLNTLRFVCTVKQELVELVELPLPMPVPDADSIVALVERALAENAPAVRLAVFDHITSPTALVLPVKRLAQVCRRYNVTVLIDGAHAPGQLPLDVCEVGADFYVGTCHKWLFSPKGSAFLWASPDAQDAVKPVVRHT